MDVVVPVWAATLARHAHNWRNFSSSSSSSSSSDSSQWRTLTQPVSTVEGFNLVASVVAVAAVVVTLLASAWRSAFSSVRLEDGAAAPDAPPTTTFDLAKASLQQQQLAVQSVVTAYRGTPVHEAAFRRSVRWRVRLLALLALVLIAIDALCLTPLRNGGVTTRNGFHTALIADVALWVLVLGITLRPLRTHEGWTRIAQLATLTVVSTTTHVTRVLIPVDEQASSSAGPFSVYKHGKTRQQLSIDAVQTIAIPLTLLALAAALTLPSGPLRVFSPKPGHEPELQMMSDQDSGASIMTFLYAGWNLPMMLKGRRTGFVEEHDVPVLSVSMRAAVLHAKMTLRNRAQAASKRNATSTQKAWRLLNSLFRTNDKLLIVVTFTNLIGSALYYLPPYLLLKIVSTMEESEARHEPRSLSFRRNVVYLVAFFVGQLVQVYAIALASNLAMATLKNRIKAQLNTLLLGKALRRKDFSAPASSSSGAGAAAASRTTPSAEGEGGNPKQDDKEDDKVDIGSKSKVLSLHTIDVQRILELVSSSFFLVNAPVEIITGSVLLFGLLGIGGFIGLATSLISIPIVYVVSKAQTRLQDELMAARDERTAALNEAMQAIRMVKLGAWEERMSERVSGPRRKELMIKRKLFVLDAITRVVGLLTPIVIVVTAFVYSTLVDGRKLTAGIAFASFAVLNELRHSIEAVPQVITESLQCFVSLRRVAVYLESPEVEPAPHQVVDGSLDGDDAASGRDAVSVAMRSATVGWPVFAGFDDGGAGVATPAPAFCLRDISVEFKAKELNLICGKLGSGKSLLLLSLLGEADLLSGQISCPRSPADAIVQSDTPAILQPGRWISPKLVAYAPQQAVILNGSIRANILWDLPLDQARYDATVKACGLLPDLAALEDGDATEIGEGGIGLSGGQKARVGLARAAYSRAQTVLLDDVLSAVDAHTAAHIHKHLLQGPLLQGRTVLLVSHQVQLVAPSAAQVIVLDDGKLKFKGDSGAFLTSEHYSGLVEELGPKDGEVAAADAEKKKTAAADEKGEVVKEIESTSEDQAAAAPADPATNESKDAGKDRDAKTTPTKDPEQARKLVSEEGRERGTIQFKFWKAYFVAAGGAAVVIPTALFVVVSELWTVVPAAWLARLSEDANRARQPGGGGMHHSLEWWLGGYAILSVAGAVVSAVRFVLFFVISYLACRTMFDNALKALFRAPLRFHDTTPRGRIMSRFGSDVQLIDEQIVFSLTFFTSRVVAFVLSCIVVSIEGSPLFLAIVALLAPAYNWVASCFRVVVRDVRRMGSTTKSPVVQTFNDILSSLAVIRAFGSSETTMQAFYRRLDHNLRFENLQMHRWSSTCMSTFSAVQLFIAGCFIASNDTTSAATAALALSFLLDLGGQLQFIVGMIGQLEYCMVAVERLTEFAETKPEAAEIVEPRPPPTWPSSGKVEFKDVRVRYAPELPDVLKGVSFTVPAGSKVGIVGPTGCGKSTTVTSLFRFVEFAGGSIEIDGLDISKIGLKDLRSRLQIVPQDPVILSGSLRDAVDVFHERTDAEILDALRKVRLIEATEPSTPLLDLNGDAHGNGVANGKGSPAAESNKNVFENLSYTIAEGGSNLSNGQRQLLCMARALLNRSKIVVFDEASSSVDTDTDALITATLRDEFASCTVITIAHRLRTIMHSDAVVVMDRGAVVEVASPAELLQRPSSHFYKLCAAAGRAEFEQLRTMAGLADSSSTATSSKAPSLL